ncbi:MAG: GspH/FimT family pseudopilin, partial [Gammaproteobacteria bacterium]|nr:GspH/FimT family pseudopilin [Gammaproteobacteria bacterium]
MSRGFTLLELLFAIAVVAIVLSLGIPSFQSSVRNSKLTASVNDMVASMQVARSEAIKRRAPVVICTSNGATNEADANCDAAAWENGWLVFADDNNNGSRDADEILLRLEGPMRKNIEVAVPNAQPLQDRLTYNSNGFPVIGNLQSAGILV